MRSVAARGHLIAATSSQAHSMEAVTKAAHALFPLHHVIAPAPSAFIKATTFRALTRAVFAIFAVQCFTLLTRITFISVINVITVIRALAPFRFISILLFLVVSLIISRAVVIAII